MNGCDICRAVASSEPVIWQGKHWSVFLALDQGYLGRLFIPAKRHVGSLSGLTTEEWAEFQEAVKKVESAITLEFGAELFNWNCLMNHAFKLPDPKPHVHWHVRPRYRHDVEVAGQTFVDPNFGHHYDRDHSLDASSEVKQAIIDRLKAQFDAR